MLQLSLLHFQDEFVIGSFRHAHGMKERTMKRFDSISQLEREQQKNEEPAAINPTFYDEKRKRKSKLRKTFDLDQSTKVSPHDIQKELFMFTWLARKMDVMKIGPATVSYQMNVLG